MIWYPITVATIGVVCIIAFLAAGRIAFAPCSATTPGRHRADGRITWRQELRLRAQRTHARAMYLAMAATLATPWPSRVEQADEIGEWITSMRRVAAGDEWAVPPVGGAGRYAHLRQAELDSTAERFYRLVEAGIRPPSPWGAPEIDDMWEPAMAGAR